MIITLIIGAPVSVLAALGTINPNDGAVDANWGTPMGAGTLSPGNQYEIVNFYVNTDASTPTRFYFRWETAGALTSKFDFLKVSLDCNNNNSYSDAVDVFVEILPSGSAGDKYVVSRGSGGATDSSGSPTNLVERVGNNVEVAPTVGPNVDWSACLASNPTIFAESINFGGPGRDVTTKRVYNLPTAITLSSFGAQSSGTPLMAGMALLGLLLVGGVAVVRRKRA